MNVLINKTNIFGGAAVAFFAAVFGDLWFLFLGFLWLNIADWLTGWWAARKEQKESSAVGLVGIVKKLVYWVVIAIAFYVAFALEKMGSVIGVDLGFLNAVGWFVLANLLVNEIRSILENVVRIDKEAVPEFLIKGLEITSNLIELAAGEGLNKDEYKDKEDKE